MTVLSSIVIWPGGPYLALGARGAGRRAGGVGDVARAVGVRRRVDRRTTGAAGAGKAGANRELQKCGGGGERIAGHVDDARSGRAAVAAGAGRGIGDRGCPRRPVDSVSGVRTKAAWSVAAAAVAAIAAVCAELQVDRRLVGNAAVRQADSAVAAIAADRARAGGTSRCAVAARGAVAARSAVSAVRMEGQVGSGQRDLGERAERDGGVAALAAWRGRACVAARGTFGFYRYRRWPDLPPPRRLRYRRRRRPGRQRRRCRRRNCR